MSDAVRSAFDIKAFFSQSNAICFSTSHSNLSDLALVSISVKGNAVTLYCGI